MRLAFVYSFILVRNHLASFTLSSRTWGILWYSMHTNQHPFVLLWFLCKPVDAYLDHLIKNASGRNHKCLYIGGGTPTACGSAKSICLELISHDLSQMEELISRPITIWIGCCFERIHGPIGFLGYNLIIACFRDWSRHQSRLIDQTGWFLIIFQNVTHLCASGKKAMWVRECR